MREEDITITIYANDTNGNTGFDSIRVIKDTTSPFIEILKPEAGKSYSSPPDFNVSIQEVYLQSTWYTLNNGSEEFTFEGETGKIDESRWDILPLGNVTIQFYAEDKAGNMSLQEITVEKILSGDKPLILGPTSILIYITMFIGIAYALVRKHKK
jgi:hypothetical protein